MTRRGTLLIPLALLAGACTGTEPAPRATATATATASGTAAATPGTAASPTPTPMAYRPDDVVLRMSVTGILRPPEDVPPMPHWTLYGDGRVVTTVVKDEPEYEGAWPDAKEYTVPVQTIPLITAAAREAGVGRRFADLPDTDAGTTVFELTDAAGTTESRVYGLDVAYGGTDPAEKRARDEIRELAERLTDFTGWLGAKPKENDPYYRPRYFAVFARPYVRRPWPKDLVDYPRTLPWTGPDLAKGTATRAGRCTVLDRHTFPTLGRKYLMQSHEETRWDAAGGTRWTIQIRLLLPQERTCRDALA